MKPMKSLLAALVLLAGLASGADVDKNASLYTRLGGMPAVRAVVDELVARIVADDRVNKWFAHAASNPEHAAAYKAKLADFVCQATGGPCKYTGLDMVSAHKNRGITAEAFGSVVEDLVATLDKLKVPPAEQKELLGLLAQLKPAVVQQ